MSRILLADDSVHAQQMGARILEEEGFDVAQVLDGNEALARLEELDPDLVLGDVFLPGVSGYQICEYVKSHPEFSNSRKGSLQHRRNHGCGYKATIPEYRDDSLSHAGRSSPSSLPKKTLFERRHQREAPRFVSNNKAIEYKSRQRKSSRK